MLNVNVYGDIPPQSAGFIAKQMLERGEYEYVAQRLGKAYTIPKKHTKTAKWRRIESFPRATAPLAEAVTPPAGRIVYTDYTVNLEQYGYWVPLSDVIFDTHDQPIPDETVTAMSEQMRETAELITIGVLKGGTTVFYANNAGSRANVASPATRGDFRRIERFLKKYKAKPIGKLINAGPNIATEPVAPAFFVLHHTDNKADVEDLEGYVPWENYASNTAVLPGEHGKVGYFRFVATPLFEPWESSGDTSDVYLAAGDVPSVAAAVDVYPMIVVAKDAFGVVNLQGMSAVTPAVVYPKAQIGDPLAQKGFASWKIYFAAVILQQNWIARLEVAATAVP